jgi:hypothetical protein
MAAPEQRKESLAPRNGHAHAARTASSRRVRGRRLLRTHFVFPSHSLLFLSLTRDSTQTHTGLNSFSPSSGDGAGRIFASDKLSKRLLQRWSIPFPINTSPAFVITTAPLRQLVLVATGTTSSRLAPFPLSGTGSCPCARKHSTALTNWRQRYRVILTHQQEMKQQ